jgi:hypothetical protein
VQTIFSVHFIGLHLMKGKVALCTFGNLYVEQSRMFPNIFITMPKELSIFLFCLGILFCYAV